MKNIVIATITAAILGTSTASAALFQPYMTDGQLLLINKPIMETSIQGGEEISCYGCISPRTGRFRNEYVRPHFRSNGTYVNGYFRS